MEHLAPVPAIEELAANNLKICVSFPLKYFACTKPNNFSDVTENFSVLCDILMAWLENPPVRIQQIPRVLVNAQTQFAINPLLALVTHCASVTDSEANSSFVAALFTVLFVTNYLTF